MIIEVLFQKFNPNDPISLISYLGQRGCKYTHVALRIDNYVYDLNLKFGLIVYSARELDSIEFDSVRVIGNSLLSEKLNAIDWSVKLKLSELVQSVVTPYDPSILTCTAWVCQILSLPIVHRPDTLWEVLMRGVDTDTSRAFTEQAEQNKAKSEGYKIAQTSDELEQGFESDDYLIGNSAIFTRDTQQSED